MNTFGGNAAACAVALKNLEIFERENLVDRSREMGEKLLEKLADLKNHPNVGDIRGKGLLLGIELVEDKETKEPAKVEKLSKVLAVCKEKGLLAGSNIDTVDGYNNVFALCPPLSITDDELDFMVNTVKEAFAEI